MSAISAVIDTKPKVVRGKKPAATKLDVADAVAGGGPAEPKAEPKSKPKAESRAKAKAETKAESKAKAEVEVEPVVEVSSDEAKPVKEKKPTLPAKFAKFMQFGFFFVTSMKDAGLLDETVSADLFERLCLFAPVDEQKAYYDAWLASAKESNKALRKTVAAQRKASLPPKERKPRLQKDPNAPKKERQPRLKKNKDNALINELADLQADSNAPPLASLASCTTQAPAHLATPVENTTQDSVEEDLDVREFVYNDKAYLIDDSTGNVFDPDSHDHIGVFNAKKNVLTFV
jgi:hypothetical protein